MYKRLKVLKKLDSTNMTLSLSRFLLANHTTPHSVTKKTPAELMFGRQLRNALHLVIPPRANDKLSKPHHKYELNESVFVKNFGRGEKWIAGKIIKLLGNRWVLVKRIDGIMCKRHINQLRHNREISQEMTESENETLLSRNFDYQFDNIETFNDHKSKEVHRDTEEGNVKNDYFSNSNQSQSPSDTVTEIMIDNDVSKNTNLDNEISVKVEVDEVTPSLGDV